MKSCRRNSSIGSVCLIGLALCAWSAGCGSGVRAKTDPNKDPDKEVQWRSVCEAAASRFERCSETWRPHDLDACSGEEVCLQGTLRPGAVGQMFACVQAHPCVPATDILSRCVAVVARAADLPEANRELRERCLHRLAPCKRSERCEPFSLLNDALRDRMSLCLQLDCDRADRCIETTFDNAGCP